MASPPPPLTPDAALPAAAAPAASAASKPAERPPASKEEDPKAAKQRGTAPCSRIVTPNPSKLSSFEFFILLVGPPIALESCEGEHIALMDCYINKTFFQSCSAQQTAFWECYRRERVRDYYMFGRAPRHGSLTALMRGSAWSCRLPGRGED